MGDGDVVELEGEDYGLALSLPPLPGNILAPDNSVNLRHGQTNLNKQLLHRYENAGQ